MTERERTIEYLVEGPPGLTPEEAERRMRDDDLWILIPEQRYAFEGEEDVRQWEEASAFAQALSEGFTAHGPGVVNEATVHLLGDLAERAEEALRRARLRLRADAKP